MPLTTEQIEQGLRLLADYCSKVTPSTWEPWHDWLMDHGSYLLTGYRDLLAAVESLEQFDALPCVNSAMQWREMPTPDNRWTLAVCSAAAHVKAGLIAQLKKGRDA